MVAAKLVGDSVGDLGRDRRQGADEGHVQLGRDLLELALEGPALVGLRGAARPSS